MKRIRLFDWGGGQDFFYQWNRLKRRERNLQLFISATWLLHIIFWLLWIFFITPYPVTLTVSLGFNLGPLVFLKDYLWPLFNALFLILNTWLVLKIYPKDILAAWLLLGVTIFIQVVVLGITTSLMMITV